MVERSRTWDYSKFEREGWLETKLMLSFYITGGLYIETPQGFGGRRAFLLWLRGGGGIAYLILRKSFYMSCRCFSCEDPVL